MPERDGDRSDRPAGRGHPQRAVVVRVLWRQRGAPPAVRADRRGRDDLAIQRQPRLAVGGRDILNKCPPPSTLRRTCTKMCTFKYVSEHVSMEVGT